MSPGDAPTIVIKAEHDLATECVELPKRSIREKGVVERPREATTVREEETKEQSRSSDLVTHFATPRGELALVRAAMKERSMEAWMNRTPKIFAPKIKEGASDE
jgi:hypothetical protein